jgi:tyrosyl-tRNA synthetase
VPSLAADLHFRGLVASVTDPELLERLDAEPVTLYAGFDPTAPSLHVGNLLQLCTLRRFQLAGHRPLVLAGGATGRIGDPGGKASERTLQSDDEIAANLAGIRPQLERFVDFSPSAGAAQAVLLDNAEWLGSMPLIEFLRDVGKHFTVNQMVAKESVRSRFERPDQGISYTEFSYMLLQAYDFLRLHLDHGCDLQIGGSDQWGNITMGVELVRKVARHEVHGLTTPLVTRADGTKFGKSEAGTDRVWLDPALTSPYRLYQFFINTEDAMVGPYLRYFTFLSHEEILDLEAETAVRPQRRVGQRALAREVTALVHGAEEAARAERASEALFGEGLADLDEATLLEVVDDAPSTEVARAELEGGGPGSRLPLVDALVRTGLARSKSAARRDIEGGGVYVNNVKEPDTERQLGPDDLLHDRYVVLRRGRRDYNLVIVG